MTNLTYSKMWGYLQRMILLIRLVPKKFFHSRRWTSCVELCKNVVNAEQENFGTMQVITCIHMEILRKATRETSVKVVFNVADIRTWYLPKQSVLSYATKLLAFSPILRIFKYHFCWGDKLNVPTKFTYSASHRF